MFVIQNHSHPQPGATVIEGSTAAVNDARTGAADSHQPAGPVGIVPVVQNIPTKPKYISILPRPPFQPPTHSVSTVAKSHVELKALLPSIFCSKPDGPSVTPEIPLKTPQNEDHSDLASSPPGKDGQQESSHSGPVTPSEPPDQEDKKSVEQDIPTFHSEAEQDGVCSEGRETPEMDNDDDQVIEPTEISKLITLLVESDQEPAEKSGEVEKKMETAEKENPSSASASQKRTLDQVDSDLPGDHCYHTKKTKTECFEDRCPSFMALRDNFQNFRLGSVYEVLTQQEYDQFSINLMTMDVQFIAQSILDIPKLKSAVIHLVMRDLSLAMDKNTTRGMGSSCLMRRKFSQLKEFDWAEVVEEASSKMPEFMQVQCHL